MEEEYVKVPVKAFKLMQYTVIWSYLRKIRREKERKERNVSIS